MRKLACVDAQRSSRYLFKRSAIRRVIHTLGVVKTTASGCSRMEAGVQRPGMEKKKAWNVADIWCALKPFTSKKSCIKKQPSLASSWK